MRIWTFLLAANLMVDSRRDPTQMSKKRLLRKNLKVRKEAAERDLSKARRKARNRIKNQENQESTTLNKRTETARNLVIAPRALNNKNQRQFPWLADDEEESTEQERTGTDLSLWYKTISTLK